VVVGDKHVSPASTRVGDGRVSSDPGVAGEQGSCAAGEQVIDPVDVEAMSLVPGGYSEDDVCTECAQGLQKEGGRRLAVGVQVSPDGNPVTTAYCFPQVSGCSREIWEFRSQGRRVGCRIKESFCVTAGEYASPCKSLCHQRMSTHGVHQCLWHVDGLCIAPANPWTVRHGIHPSECE
jgi:hypothetical protein